MWCCAYSGGRRHPACQIGAPRPVSTRQLVIVQKLSSSYVAPTTCWRVCCRLNATLVDDLSLAACGSARNSPDISDQGTIQVGELGCTEAITKKGGCESRERVAPRHGTPKRVSGSGSRSTTWIRFGSVNSRDRPVEQREKTDRHNAEKHKTLDDGNRRSFADK